MSKYHEARHELKALVVETLRQRAAASLGGVATPPDFDELLSLKTDQMLDRFERLATNHSRSDFWRGVIQSGIAALLVFVLIAFFALVIYGSKQNPFQILSDAAKPTPPPTQESKQRTGPE